MLIGRPSTRRHTSSATRTASARVAPVTTTQNSSPPIRAARLPGTSPLAWLTAWPTEAIRRSPASWPKESLTCFSRLMSASTTETGKVRCLPGGHLVREPVVDGAAVGQPGERVLERQPLDPREVVGLHDAGSDVGRDRSGELQVGRAEPRLARRGASRTARPTPGRRR